MVKIIYILIALLIVELVVNIGLVILLVFVLLNNKSQKNSYVEREDNKNVTNEMAGNEHLEKDSVSQTSFQTAKYSDRPKVVAPDLLWERKTAILHETESEQPARVVITLTDVNDDGRVYRCELEDQIQIGKGRHSDMYIPFDDRIKRRHCKLCRVADDVYLYPVNDSATTVNDEIVGTEGILLHDQDELTMGNTRLRVEIFS